MMQPGDARGSRRGAVFLSAAALTLVCFGSTRLRGLMVNTALLAGGALAVSAPIGSLLGIVIAKVDVPGRRLLAALMAGQLFAPLYVYAGAWHSVLGPGGWWTRRTGDGYADPWLAGWRGAIWVHGMAAAPWVALAVAGSLGTVERRLEEESLLDAPPWRVLMRVSLRRAAGGLLVAAAWVAMVCATEITVTDLYQIRTFAEEAYVEASLGSLVGAAAPGTRTAAGVAGPIDPLTVEPFVASDLALGVLALALLALAALRLLVPLLPAAATIVADAGWKWRPERQKLAATIVWLLAGAVVVVPLLGLAWQAGQFVVRDGAVYERSWSLAKTLTMVARSPWEHRREWGWSLAIGGMAVAAAAAIGLLGAWLVRLRPRWSGLVAAAIGASLAIPAPLVGVWTIAALSRPPGSPLACLATLYDHTLAAPVFVQAVRAAPVAALWFWSLFANLPQDLLEAARSEGAGPWARLWRVAVPLRRAGLAAGCVAALAIAVGELSATLLVLPPGATTLSVRVFQLLHYGVDDRVAALCLAIVGTVGLTTTIVLWGVGRSARHRVQPPSTM